MGQPILEQPQPSVCLDSTLTPQCWPNPTQVLHQGLNLGSAHVESQSSWSPGARVGGFYELFISTGESLARAGVQDGAGQGREGEATFAL